MNRVISIDFSHLLHRSVFANLKMIEETPSFLSHVMLGSIISIMKKFDVKNDPADVIIATDCSRKNNWRTKFYLEGKEGFPEYSEETYKGNRAKSMKVPWDEIYTSTGKLLKALEESTDIKVISHENAEADDVIYTASKEYERSIIVSSDKDFHQLISENVKQYDPLKKKFVKIEEDQKRLLQKHILTGQSRKDNIFPCRKKLGPKTAEKLIEYLDSHLEADEELRNRYKFNEKLIDLSKVPVEIYDEIKREINKDQRNFSTNNLLDFFRENGLRKITEEIDLFSIKKSNSLF